MVTEETLDEELLNAARAGKDAKYSIGGTTVTMDSLEKTR